MSQLEDVVSSIKPLEVQGLFPQKQGGEGVWGLSNIDFFQTKRVFPGFIFPHSLLFVCLEEGVFKLQRLICHMAQSGNSAIPYLGTNWKYLFCICGLGLNHLPLYLVVIAMFSFSKLLFFHLYLFALVLLVEGREVKNCQEVTYFGVSTP